MATSGTAIYYDGLTSRRQDVHLSLDHDLTLIRPDGATIAVWPLADLRELEAPRGTMRLTRLGGPPLARLEIRDAALAAAARAAAPSLGVAQATERGAVRKVVFWTVAAVISLSAFALFGVPALADKLTPLLPWSVDRRMGEAADSQLRFVLPTGEGGFSCGDRESEKEGRAALDLLAGRMSLIAGLPGPLTVVAVRSPIPNALALPGGIVYLFDGLLQQAESADEIAAVLAHEIGHVARRDGTRRALQAGGTSLLLGFALGDFAGGGAAIFIARALTEASYSRDAEAAADAYAINLMKRMKADPRGLGTLLSRLDKSDEAEGSPLDYLASHPATAERKRAIDAAAGDAPTEPLIDQRQFKALKTICGTRP